MIKPQDVEEMLQGRTLFRGQALPWRLSPRPYFLSKTQVKQLEGLGHILARFQDTAHLLYQKSARQELHPWLAKALDAGKPQWLVDIQHTDSMLKDAPRIIRPDLLCGEAGFALSELDSVPGGMGITLFLSQLYNQGGFRIVGGKRGMAECFTAAHPQGAVIAVSAEAADYRAEMDYLASECGSQFSTCDAETMSPNVKSLYRFFELFDTENIPSAQEMIEHCAQGELEMSPPPIYHLEEKAWLGYFHTPGLQSFWKQHLRGAHWERLRQLIPFSWVPDPAPLPPQAALPKLNLNSWQELAKLSQKERHLVLKVSGFDETAWGARGVYMGHDMPADEWRSILEIALNDYPERLWVMQEFKEAQSIEHPYYDADGEINMMKGRVRLCPYYFRLPGGETRLGGCLATIAPADKKKIHGMRDAVLVPCALS